MNELIKVSIENDRQLVSARDLYKGLNIKTRFSQWVTQNFKHFRENHDFSCVVTTTQQNQYGGTKEIQDYAMTLEMAKHIAMMTGTPKGYEVRDYFIELERKWNDPQEIVKRGYAILQNENMQLKLENDQLKPKALFADAVEASKSSILVGELAKVLRQNGVKIGQNRLFKWLHNNYLIKRGEAINQPTQYAIENGWFEIKKRTGINPDGSTWASSTTKVTGKGQIYFIDKFLQKS